jgi:hypothetical protein
MVAQSGRGMGNRGKVRLGESIYFSGRHGFLPVRFFGMPFFHGIKQPTLVF